MKYERFEVFNGEPTHWCSNHMGKAVREGGEWIITNGGKSRRWICARCVAAKKARKEAAR